MSALKANSEIQTPSPWPFYGYTPGNVTCACAVTGELFFGASGSYRSMEGAVLAAKKEEAENGQLAGKMSDLKVRHSRELDALNSLIHQLAFQNKDLLEKMEFKVVLADGIELFGDEKSVNAVQDIIIHRTTDTSSN